MTTLWNRGETVGYKLTDLRAMLENARHTHEGEGWENAVYLVSIRTGIPVTRLKKHFEEVEVTPAEIYHRKAISRALDDRHRRAAFWMRRGVDKLIAGRQATWEKSMIAMRHREMGKTFREVGEIMGLSHERVSQMAQKEERKKRHPRWNGRRAPVEYHYYDADEAAERDDLRRLLESPQTIAMIEALAKGEEK